MKKQVHPNYIRASNIIFGSFGIGLLGLFFSDKILSTWQNNIFSIWQNIFFIVIFLIVLFLVAGIGLAVRRGVDSIKYLFIVMTILGIMVIPLRINDLMQKPDHGILVMAQTIMQVWAVILLIKIPKPLINNPDDEQS